MDTAIFLPEQGKQEELNAKDITTRDRHKYSNRLICPECGEKVFIRISDKQKNYFAHFQKVKSSIECDLRVDGKSTLTIYERLGVPLYLTFSKIFGYKLHFGLKSINEKMLLEAESMRAYLEVEIKNNDFIRVNINRKNFIANDINLFQISNYPDFNQAFKINYYNLPFSFNKWANFIDSILEDGILFSTNSNIGKSIRHGDTIFSDETYLWLVPRKLSNINITEKNAIYKGNIVLNEKTHFIYEVQFVKSQKDLSLFNRIAEVLYQKLKVVLLKGTNELKLVWPPSIRTEGGYTVSNKGRIHFVTKSLNTKPKIYMYKNDGYKNPTPIESRLINESFYLNYILKDEELQFNVNRKITSAGIDINYSEIQYGGEETYIKDVNSDTEYSLYTNNKISNKNLKFKSNIKLKSVIVDQNKKVTVADHREGLFDLSLLNFKDTLYLLNKEKIMLAIQVAEDFEQNIISFMTLKKILLNKYETIPLKYKARQSIYKHIEIDSRYYKYFKEILKTNRIPVILNSILEVSN